MCRDRGMFPVPADKERAETPFPSLPRATQRFAAAADDAGTLHAPIVESRELGLPEKSTPPPPLLWPQSLPAGPSRSAALARSPPFQTPPAPPASNLPQDR